MKKSVYAMAVGAFGIITTELGIIGILPLLSKEFTVSIQTVSWLLSAFALTIAVFGPAMTVLTSNVNKKTILLMVLSLFIVSNLVSAIAPNFTVLLIARIIPAFMHPVFWAVSINAAAKSVSEKDAPKMVSIVLMGATGAMVIGAPLFSFVSVTWNWQMAFVWCSVINTAGLASIWAFVESSPVTEKVTNHLHLQILRKPLLWLTLFVSCIFTAGILATYTYVAEYSQKITLVSGNKISILLLIFGIAGFFGNWFAGLMLSKSIVGTLRFFLLALGVTLLMVYVFGFSYPAMLLLMIPWGFFHAMGPLTGLIFTSSSAKESPELANSLMASFANLGIAIGAMVGGMVIHQFGIHQIIFASLVLLMLALAASFFSKHLVGVAA